jgi:PleD family two-component response regulator
MHTNDPDRCPAGHDLDHDGHRLVVQCQRSINHEGKHCFEEDHYLIRWLDDEAMKPHENAMPTQILLVDDNPTALDAVAVMLRTKLSHVEVNVCLSARRAWEAIANFDYHLVIVDQCMPEMDGTELIHRIRAIRPKLPMLLMFDDLNKGLESKAVEMGASGFFYKSLDADTLKSRVEEALDTASRPMDYVAG